MKASKIATEPVPKVLTSLPGKLQQAAETVNETSAEPQQPNRKKFPDLSSKLRHVTTSVFAFRVSGQA